MDSCACRHGCSKTVEGDYGLCGRCWDAGCIRVDLIRRSVAYPPSAFSPLEVAIKALEEIRGRRVDRNGYCFICEQRGHHEAEDCGIASRALTTIRAASGPAEPLVTFPHAGEVRRQLGIEPSVAAGPWEAPVARPLCKVCGRKGRMLSAARGDGIQAPCFGCGQLTECVFDGYDATPTPSTRPGKEPAR